MLRAQAILAATNSTSQLLEFQNANSFRLFQKHQQTIAKKKKSRPTTLLKLINNKLKRSSTKVSH